MRRMRKDESGVDWEVKKNTGREKTKVVMDKT